MSPPCLACEALATFTVPADGKRPQQYTPQPPEPVLGIIIARHAEGYRVDIGSSQAAALDALAFEGATKRNKPNLKVRPPSG